MAQHRISINSEGGEIMKEEVKINIILGVMIVIICIADILLYVHRFGWPV